MSNPHQEHNCWWFLPARWFWRTWSAKCACWGRIASCLIPCSHLPCDSCVPTLGPECQETQWTARHSLPPWDCLPPPGLSSQSLSCRLLVVMAVSVWEGECLGHAQMHVTGAHPHACGRIPVSAWQISAVQVEGREVIPVPNLPVLPLPSGVQSALLIQ